MQRDVIPSNLLTNPNWWAAYLHETVARGLIGGDDEGRDPYELLNPVLGSTCEEANALWTELLERPAYWPQFILSLQGGHALSVTFFGGPRFDIEYRYGAPAGESVLLACQGPSFTLGGLRWPEVESVLADNPQVGELASLLLAQAVSVSSNEISSAENRIGAALRVAGRGSEPPEVLAETIVNGMRVGANSWRFDVQLGWVSKNWRLWRCPERYRRGLSGLSEGSFLLFREFTENLGLNPSQ